MDAHELQQRIAAFPRWHYRFEFDGGIATPTPEVTSANRHEQRRRYFFAPLVQLCGGPLAGRPVLELADQFGYESVPLALNMSDYAGLADYRDQRRLAFLCSRSHTLSGRVAEERPSLIPWWVTAARNRRRRR